MRAYAAIAGIARVPGPMAKLLLTQAQVRQPTAGNAAINGHVSFAAH